MHISVTQWIKKNSIILFNTGSLVGTMLVTSLLGFAYWLVAARYFPSDAVGLASAATSSMMLLSTLLVLGQGTLLITELPRNHGKEGSLISASTLIVGAASLAGGIIFAVCAPFISPQLGQFGSSPQSVFLFALGVCMAAVTVILDQAVIGMLQGGLQLWRNALFSIAKLALLAVLGQFYKNLSGISIYTIWTVGNIISLLPLFLFIIKKKKTSLKYYIPQWNTTRKMGSAAIQHHVLNLVLQAPTQALPILVTILLSAKMNAWFYIASMIANFIFSLSTSLTTVLHAANAAQAATLTQKSRLTVSLSILASLILGSILMFGAQPILHFFGENYALYASSSLRILLLAAIPLVIKNHYIAICRIKDQVARAILPVMVGACLELGIAAVGARLGGLSGLSLGWVLALVLEAIWMSPIVAQTLIGQSALDRYLDEVAATDTVMLPALNQFAPSGMIQLSTFGNAITLTEIDTLQLPIVRSNTARKQRKEHPVDNGNWTSLNGKDSKSPSLSLNNVYATHANGQGEAINFAFTPENLSSSMDQPHAYTRNEMIPQRLPGAIADAATVSMPKVAPTNAIAQPMNTVSEQSDSNNENDSTVRISKKEIAYLYSAQARTSQQQVSEHKSEHKGLRLHPLHSRVRIVPVETGKTDEKS
ncbi:hypothetical protein [Dictyobacter arantiisoli]|uniref:Polysaccharide biosynthesis protein C-terminal domain-containing protein n=1 Tax=Dictyobacter arantiisoli TaxID=2014874 RepID=A0A5A5TAI0_9CHLR|nr:hypothetical protein [Dictyobacter arantiisoli]GCF08023.1 hypothetical protein KDI_15870 [Dictyobacter arantiisoli]